jgi:hypothetical protein
LSEIRPRAPTNASDGQRPFHRITYKKAGMQADPTASTYIVHVTGFDRKSSKKMLLMTALVEGGFSKTSTNHFEKGEKSAGAIEFVKAAKMAMDTHIGGNKRNALLMANDFRLPP